MEMFARKYFLESCCGTPFKVTIFPEIFRKVRR